MSVLTIVRHGQASLFAADYDKLSEIGEQQGRALGDYWASQQLPIDRVYSGPRLRHRHSAELTGQAYAAAGLRWPEPDVLDELDEFDMDGLIHRFAPRLAERDARFAQLASDFLQCEEHHPDRPQRFQRMFETLLQAWQVSDAPDCDVEPWPTFQQRVWNAIRRIQQDSDRGARTVIFSSGGVVGCALQHALSVTDKAPLELSWRIRNGSLTDFVFTPDRFTLDAFNMIPHLTDPALWTYR
mgnify:CR=1 FL=1